jgi:hypothetical protein
MPQRPEEDLHLLGRKTLPVDVRHGGQAAGSRSAE